MHIPYTLYCIFADVFQSAKYELRRIIVDYVTSCFVVESLTGYLILK